MQWRNARGSFGKAFDLYRRALLEARAEWSALALVLISGVAWTPVALLFPLPLKIVVDTVLGGKPLEGIAASVIPSALGDDPARLLLVTIAFSLGLCLLGVAY